MPTQVEQRLARREVLKVDRRGGRIARVGVHEARALEGEPAAAKAVGEVDVDRRDRGVGVLGERLRAARVKPLADARPRPLVRLAVELLGELGGALVAQQGHRLVVAQAEARIAVAEVAEGVLRAHGGELFLVALVQPVEDCAEGAVEHVEHLVIVLEEGHLHVEADELGHVPVRERVLRAEDGRDLEDAVEVRHQRHLLVQLRRLREAGGRAKVVCPEDVGAALGLAGDELRRLDLEEALRAERLAEEGADGRLDAQDGAVCGHAQVDPAVVEAQLLPDARQRSVGVFGGVHLGLRPRGVLDLEGKLGRGGGDEPHLADRDLDPVLRAGEHLCGLQPPLDLDDRLLGEGLQRGEHLLGLARVRGVAKEDGLHRVQRPRPHHQEGGAPLPSHRREPATHHNLVARPRPARHAQLRHGRRREVGPPLGAHYHAKVGKPPRRHRLLWATVAAAATLHRARGGRAAAAAAAGCLGRLLRLLLGDLPRF
mmetsp:Transcript_50008/g.163385  ORF Transcript_50008/g.163385 Transcript_50008/m.163385 type:complete len:485 (+) Transcript_50008:520-1974(+)